MPRQRFSRCPGCRFPRAPRGDSWRYCRGCGRPATSARCRRRGRHRCLRRRVGRQSTVDLQGGISALSIALLAQRHAKATVRRRVARIEHDRSTIVGYRRFPLLLEPKGIGPCDVPDLGMGGGQERGQIQRHCRQRAYAHDQDDRHRSKGLLPAPVHEGTPDRGGQHDRHRAGQQEADVRTKERQCEYGSRQPCPARDVGSGPCAMPAPRTRSSAATARRSPEGRRGRGQALLDPSATVSTR